MNPLSALLLTHVKPGGMILLRWIVFQINKDEEQSVCNCGKRTIGLYDVGAPSRKFLAFDIVPTKEFVVGISEKRQNFVKEGYADTCERQKRGRIISCFRVIHPLNNVLATRVRA